MQSVRSKMMMMMKTMVMPTP